MKMPCQFCASCISKIPEPTRITIACPKTLINLKLYDEAIEISESAIDAEHNVTRTRIKLAEVYHISGNKERAAETWQTLLDRKSATDPDFS